MAHFELEELKATIAGKWILFDNCVITRALDHPEDFSPLMELLEGSRCTPSYFSFVEFEFLRGAYQAGHREKRMKFLELAFSKLPHPDKGLVDDAIAVANFYAARKHSSSSIVDCCIAAQACRHPDKLFIATLDLQDFPTTLFDPVYLYPIETGGALVPVGIYRLKKDVAIAHGLSKR